MPINTSPNILECVASFEDLEAKEEEKKEEEEEEDDEGDDEGEDLCNKLRICLCYEEEEEEEEHQIY